ncbi:HET domain-containing protein [Xylaria acuta]|nr:HET domain-containing protein [Xylaria acuta]
METGRSGFYMRLPPNTIRLLRINTNTEDSEAGSLDVVGLDVAPPYYALSHSWSAQDRTTPIQIAGRTFYVCPDLAAGIRRLQELAAPDSDLSPTVKYIWIDNICINQGDILERSSQVHHMGDIYLRAIRTLIWLGPDISSYSAAWRLLDNIYSVFKGQCPEATAFHRVPNKMYSHSSHAASGLPNWASDQWLCFEKLMKLRWFSRIWVVQEVILSRQDPVIIHGQHLFSWHRLECAASWLRRNGYARLDSIPEEILNVDAMSLIRQSQARWPLDALMSITQIKFHATDQRDKIYGLFGLAAETQDISNLPDALIPDYTLDVKQTFQKVARHLLVQNRSLAIFTRAHGTSGSLSRMRRKYDFADFPSWLPDWSDFYKYRRDIQRSFSWIDFDISEPPRFGFPKHYNASAGLQAKLHNTVDNSVLRIEAMRVDKIILVLPMNKGNLSNTEFCQSFRSTIRNACEAALPLLAEMGISAWAGHIVKTTTAEQYLIYGRQWDQCFKDGVAFLHEIFVHNKEQRCFLSVEGKSIDFLRQFSAGGESEAYAAVARHFCFNRSFVLTSAGRMGIGPSDSRTGDTVTIIPGGGVPYIIRQHGSTWVLVGESYIHGIMNGEMVKTRHGHLVHQETLDFH